MADSDYLLDLAHERWPEILTLYKRFEDKKPVMLFDIQEQRIYAYPYADFHRDLSEKSQRSLKTQYEKAFREGEMVIFVRDNEQKRLVSFSYTHPLILSHPPQGNSGKHGSRATEMRQPHRVCV